MKSRAFVPNRVSRCVMVFASLAGLPMSVALAHEDEPFELDRLPHVIAPAYRAAELDQLGASERGALPSFQSRNVVLLSWLPLNQFSPTLTSGAVVEGYVSPSGREYALFGHSGGSSYVEVTDPDNARIVATIAGPTSLWRDIAVYQNTAYVVSEGGGGVQIVDLSNIDLNIVSLVGSISTPNTSRTHTVHVNKESGFLYRCGGGNWQTPGRAGLRIYSLANPLAPVAVGQWTPRYVHECQVVNWTSPPFAGRELAFVYSEDTSGGTNPKMEILDVTDKANITTVGSAAWANGVFSHQGWLSPDRRYVYLNDELDELNAGQPCITRIVDVQNLAAPVVVGLFGNGLSSIDHNEYTRDNRLFQSNYRTGLRVWDTTNPVAPIEAAWFDSFPDSDSQNFNGLWDNDPFLPSRIVLGSDIESGLFIWWVGDPQLAYAYPDGRPEKFRLAGESFRVNIAAQNGGVLDGASVRFHYDAGAGFVSIPLVNISGDEWRADLPTLPCGTKINWYLAADSNRIAFRDPPLGPLSPYSAVVATASTVGFSDNMETATGWAVGATGDTATGGVWVRADPVGTTAQPESDASAIGNICWITGNGAVGGAPGASDVDGGRTSLVSPTFSAIGATGTAYLSYSRWYNNNDAGGVPDDSLTVQISNNNGSTWVALEVVSNTEGRWVPKLFRIADIIAPTAQMKIRFQASDSGAASTVEAGVDDVRVSFMRCDDLPGDTDGDCSVGLADIAEVVGGWGAMVTPGATGDANNDGVIDLADIALVVQNWFGVCPP